MRFYLNNVWMLCIRILTVLIFYQVCRILYFIYNINYFQSIDLETYIYILFGSIKFDISAVMYLNLLLIFFSLIPINLLIKKWYKSLLAYLFIVTNSIGILSNIVDIFHYPFTKNRFTISSINEFSNEKNIGAFILRFTYEYWFIIPLMIIIVYILYIISKRTKTKSSTFSLKAKPRIAIF